MKLQVSAKGATSAFLILLGICSAAAVVPYGALIASDAFSWRPIGFITAIVVGWPLVAFGWTTLVWRLIDRRFGVDRRAWIALAGGAAAAAASVYGLVQWSEARYGYWDPDFVGITLVLPYGVSLLAYGLAVQLAQRSPSLVVRASTFVLSLVVVGLVTLNVLVGLRDELSGAWPFIAFGLAGPAIVGAAAIVAALRPASRER